MCLHFILRIEADYVIRAMDKEVLSSINYLTDLGTLMRQDSQSEIPRRCPFLYILGLRIVVSFPILRALSNSVCHRGPASEDKGMDMSV